jgi:protein gp37
MADWLDPEIPTDWLADMLDTIRQTPSLDWLLLTKRPQLWDSRMRAVFGHLQSQPGPTPEKPLWAWLDRWVPWNGKHRFDPPANIWLGTSTETQETANSRIPDLLEIPARCHFLSMEPLLGPVDLAYWTYEPVAPQIDWVIVGGESGPHARPMEANWVRHIRDDCHTAGVPFFFKQWGGGQKSKAGRELDGKNHDEFPTPTGSLHSACSALYGRVIAPSQDALMHKVWGPFPWMIEAFTGRFDDDRYHQMNQWLTDRFGREASPIHNIPGRWHRGGATINGHTWIGFATEEMLATFEEHWPNDSSVATSGA